MPRVKRCSSVETNYDTDEMLTVDFDTDNSLSEMFPDNQAKTCPRCYETLMYDEVTTQKGDLWKYYRCITLNDYTKCYVACGVDDADLYLDKVRDTLHPVYVGGPHCLPASHMRCYCNLSLILTLSKSDKNKNRLYFKCPRTKCQFFQWADVEPFGRVRRWLVQGVKPDAKHKEQRHKPYDLAEPIQTRPSFEARRGRGVSPKKLYTVDTV